MTDPALREHGRQRHRADEARRHQPGHRARRRTRDHALHGPPRPARRVLRRPARHRRRGDGGREDGARRQGEQGARRRDQQPRAARGRASPATTATSITRDAARRAARPRGRGHARSTPRSSTTSSRTASSRSSPRSRRARTAAASTSTPTSSPASSRPRSSADKVIFLTDVDGLYADFADKDSLISALTPAEAEEMIASDAARGRHDPEGRRVHARAARRVSAGTHPQRHGAARAAARGLHRRGRRHDDQQPTTWRRGGEEA